jgi:hypothetical protein
MRRWETCIKKLKKYEGEIMKRTREKRKKQAGALMLKVLTHLYRNAKFNNWAILIRKRATQVQRLVRSNQACQVARVAVLERIWGRIENDENVRDRMRRELVGSMGVNESDLVVDLGYGEYTVSEVARRDAIRLYLRSCRVKHSQLVSDRHHGMAVEVMSEGLFGAKIDVEGVKAMLGGGGEKKKEVVKVEKKVEEVNAAERVCAGKNKEANKAPTRRKSFEKAPQPTRRRSFENKAGQDKAKSAAEAPQPTRRRSFDNKVGQDKAKSDAFTARRPSIEEKKILVLSSRDEPKLKPRKTVPKLWFPMHVYSLVNNTSGSPLVGIAVNTFCDAVEAYILESKHSSPAKTPVVTDEEKRLGYERDKEEFRRKLEEKGTANDKTGRGGIVYN